MSDVDLAVDVLKKFIRNGADTEVQVTDARLAASVILSHFEKQMRVESHPLPESIQNEVDKIFDNRYPAKQTEWWF